MFTEFMNTYGLMIIGVVFVALAGTLGRVAYKACKTCLDTPAKQDAARMAVRYVEQIYKDLKGPKKLEQALETVSVLLRKKGIKWSRDEMIVIIESMVEEMNEYLKPPLLDAVTAEAVRITEDDE